MPTPLPVPRPLGTYGSLTEESFEHLWRIGYSYICVGGVAWEDDEKLKQQRALVAAWSERIRLYSLHFPSLFNTLDFDVEKTVKQLDDWMHKGGELGLKWGAIHARPGSLPNWNGNPDPAAIQAYEDRLVACLKQVAEHTRDSGMGLSLENDIWDKRVHNWLCTAEDLVRIVSRVNAPNIGICLDTGHVPISGLDPAETIRALGHWFVDTHFNDTFGYFPGRTVWDCDIHLPVGVGSINWIEVMDALDAIDFRHPVCFEAGGQAYPHEAARICHDLWRAVELARWRWDTFGNRPGGGTAPRGPHTAIPGPGSE